MNKTQNQMGDGQTVEKTWKMIARDLTEDEATNYGKQVRNQQLYNHRKDAKFIKIEESNGKYFVYCTSYWPVLSDDEFRRFKNMGLL